MKTAGRITQTMTLTILMLMIAVLAISGTVIAKDGTAEMEQQAYIKVQKDSYVQNIRTFLGENGYSDSAVVMNHVIQEDGSVEYLVKIHHRRLLKLSREERKELLDQCGELDASMNINYEIF